MARRNKSRAKVRGAQQFDGRAPDAAPTLSTPLNSSPAVGVDPLATAAAGNQITQEDAIRLSDLRNAESVPVAQEALRLIAQSEALMGDGDRDKFEDAYGTLANQIIQVYLDHDVKIGNVAHIKALALQPLEWAFGVVEAKMNDNLRRLQEKSFGKELSTMGINELNGRLTGTHVEGEKEEQKDKFGRVLNADGSVKTEEQVAAEKAKSEADANKPGATGQTDSTMPNEDRAKNTTGEGGATGAGTESTPDQDV